MDSCITKDREKFKLNNLEGYLRIKSVPVISFGQN